MTSNPLPRKKPARQKAGRRKAQTTDRRRQALDLRIAGKTYEAIGLALGISKPSAYELVMGALDDLAKQTIDDAEKLRAIELERIDAVIGGLWPNRKDPQVANAILRASDRRARLLGLDAPEKQDVHVHGDVDNAVERAREKWRSSLEQAAKDAAAKSQG